MKKLVVLLSALALSVVGAMAQGQIAFANQGTGIQVMVSSNLDGTGAVPIGGNSALAAAIGGGPSNVVVQLWMATNGAAVTLGQTAPIGMVLVGVTTNSASVSSLANGVFNGGNPYTLGLPWDGSFQVEYAYYATDRTDGQFGPLWGHSTLATGYSLSLNPSPTTATFGVGANQVGSFTLHPVPEPSTIALGGLGVAALLLFRRRK